MTSSKKLQVFVSSTYKDLKSERQAAVEAILKAGHIPAGMELFSSGSESQLETIRRWIDDSDVYMLILGGRYGSVDTATSLSYTELEYDYAVATGKPIFAVVITEEAIDSKLKNEGRDVIESEYTKELKFFRKKVLDRISSFFNDNKDIKLAVHETMADYAKRLDFTGWVSGKEVIDTTPLLDEISRLRHEKEQLQLEISKLKSSPPTIKNSNNKAWDEDELREIESIIKEIEVSTKVFNKDKESPASKYSIFHLLTRLRDKFITGISNKYGATDSDVFLYYNVCPKLEIHDLAALDNVPGVQWQRYRLTSKGKALIALIDKNRIVKKTPENTITTAETVKEPAIKKSRKRVIKVEAELKPE